MSPARSFALLHREDETFSPKVVIIAQITGLCLQKNRLQRSISALPQAACAVLRRFLFQAELLRVEIRVIPEASHDLGVILQDRIRVLKVSSQTTVLGL